MRRDFSLSFGFSLAVWRMGVGVTFTVLPPDFRGGGIFTGIIFRMARSVCGENCDIFIHLLMGGSPLCRTIDKVQFGQ